MSRTGQGLVGVVAVVLGSAGLWHVYTASQSQATAAPALVQPAVVDPASQWIATYRHDASSDATFHKVMPVGAAGVSDATLRDARVVLCHYDTRSKAGTPQAANDRQLNKDVAVMAKKDHVRPNMAKSVMGWASGRTNCAGT